jgi:hypothetical protein
MHPVIKDLIRVDNYPAYLAIILAALGVLDNLSPDHRSQIILAILALVSVNIIAERLTVFRKLLDTNRAGSRLRSREDADFEHFHQYIQGGTEIFIAALSLNFICNNQPTDLERGIEDGVDFRFVIVDPELPDAAMQQIAEHDERGEMRNAKALRDEIERSRMTLSRIKKSPKATGTVMLKAGKGLPVLTITMVNPRSRNGKMRVELRPYFRNVGPRPYFELRKTNPEDAHWYAHFYEHYYEKLWEDSDEITL